MKPRSAVVFLTAFVVIAPIGAWSQQRDTFQQPTQTEMNSVLTEQEEQSFDTRLRAAQSEQVRAQILAERDYLLRVRFIQQSDQQQIPPGPRELTEDPIMSEVPTPRSNRSWVSGTIPGGALAPTGTGTSPSTTTGGWGHEP